MKTEKFLPLLFTFLTVPEAPTLIIFFVKGQKGIIFLLTQILKPGPAKIKMRPASYQVRVISLFTRQKSLKTGSDEK